MRKIITLAFFLLVVLNVYAITEKEKKDMETYLDNVKDDRAKFEIFLAFADAKNINLEEAGLKKKVEDKAKQFGILLFPYQGITGIDSTKADAKTLTSLGETRIEQELAIAAKKMSLDKISSFWPIFFVLVSFLIVFLVLEFYKREKMKTGEGTEEKKRRKIK